MIRYLLALFVTFGVAFSALAVEVKDLYQGAVPVADRSIATQEAALGIAFEQVIVKLTGNGQAPQQPMLAAASKHADQYVEQFQTEQNDDDQTVVVAQFDRSRVNKLLRRAKQPLWGERRPLSVVWVVEQTDKGQQLINDEQRLQPMFLQAKRRGIPVLLPMLDLDDLSQVSPSDVWGLFTDVLKDASRRYDAEQVVAVKMVQSGEQIRLIWQADDMTGAGQSFHGEVTAEPGDAMPALINQLTDQMASSYAVQTSISDNDNVLLEIHNIDSLASFLNVETTLDSLAIIDHFSLVSLSSQQAIFKVSALGNRDDLLHSLDLDSNLERISKLNGGSSMQPTQSPIRLMWRR